MPQLRPMLLEQELHDYIVIIVPTAGNLAGQLDQDALLTELGETRDPPEDTP